MTKILKRDPLLDHYIYEKQTNPDANLVMRAFRERDVDAVNRIVEIANGYRDFVKSESDWKVVEELFAFWSSRWPEEYAEFKAAIPQIRSTRGEGGYSSTKEIKYVAAIPPRFERMMKAIFPAQEWDKKFVNKFVKKYRIFKVGGENN